MFCAFYIVIQYIFDNTFFILGVKIKVTSQILVLQNENLVKQIHSKRTRFQKNWSLYLSLKKNTFRKKFTSQKIRTRKYSLHY